MVKRTYPGAIFKEAGMVYIPGMSGEDRPPTKTVQYVPAALADALVDALIASRDNYGKYGGLVNDPNAPGELITKINNALEKAGVTGG